MIVSGKNKLSQEILEYQPDAVEIEEHSVSGKIRWVLYIILCSLVLCVAGASIFSVDRIVVGDGQLITTSPTIVVQSLNTAIIRTITVRIGEVVEKGQVLATLDSTFASADLGALSKQRLALSAQIRRIQAELQHQPFSALPEEAENGRLQAQIFNQRKIILEKNKQTNTDKIAALNSKIALNAIQYRGKKQQLKLLRDVEGATAKLPQNDVNFRLKLLESQKARQQTSNDIENLMAEKEVLTNELKQGKSEWQRYLEERNGQLLEQEVQLRSELEKISEEMNKAKRLHELVSLRAPQRGVVQSIAERSVGSIIQAAEPFITLVPFGSAIEAEVYILSKDIARIRTKDSVRIKLDAFPFQRHGTLPGEVRMISEDSFHRRDKTMIPADTVNESAGAFYKTRVRLISTKLKKVPKGFRLQPGMKVRAEIKIGKRSIISYFLYPVIRIFDESLREP